jgi:viologen exporter family transport system permease protein
MMPYWAVLTAKFRTLLQYRAAALAGFACQLFFGWVILMGYRGFYAAVDAPQPMTLAEITSYVWLGQAMLGLLPWAADPDMRLMMRQGSVAYELLRPVDVYWLWYSRAIAQRVGPTLLRSVPMFIVASLFLGLEPPVSWASGLAWAAATVGAVLIAAAIATFLGISLLWTVSGDGVNTIVPAMVIIFSGMLVPIPLMPQWAQTILNALPFRGIADIPFRLYLGHIPAGQVWPTLAHQLLWVAILVAVSRSILNRGLRRLVIQGG